ncbi:immune inhibitor A domain-containing protein [Kytococcus sp. Marseille-QA3725]
MNARTSTRLSGAALVAFAMAATPFAQVSAVAPQDDANSQEQRQDDFPHPLGDKQRAMRQTATNQLLRGEAKVVTRNGSRSVQLGEGEDAQYVQYDTERTANVLTFLTEFGDKIDPSRGGTPGPLHNQIEEPDRAEDNSTVWEEDFDTAYYEDLMLGEENSFRDFFRKQSSGRFDVEAGVYDWVKVPFNEARYGANSDDPDVEAEGYWNYVKDSAEAWYDDQVVQGKTKDQIAAELAEYDVWDRYDHDDDGDFNEPDGYIDHFQLVHAGEDESAGGGAQGEDAIWAHRWYAFPTDEGKTGPEGNLKGGVPIGDTGLWIGDYTTEPENGGMGVFVHEFSHDLGLPDYYATDGGDNGVSFWSLMSSGSWLNHGKDGIGDSAGFYGPKEKLQLGWLDFEVVQPEENVTKTLGPAHSSTENPQAVAVPLPPQTITTEYNTPFEGANEFWGGAEDNLDSSMTRTIDLTGASSASVSAKAELFIEEAYDFLYAEVSTDGGESWERVGENTGFSEGWVDLDYDLSEYLGQQVQFRFHAKNDGGMNEDGAFLDNVTVTVDGKSEVDGAEGESTWELDGFTVIDGTSTREAEHAYLVENRQYGSYDDTLRTGPYNFGWRDARPNWVERFPYQNGMLVWYSNDAYVDNNTATHPGGGQALPVDANPEALAWNGGGLMSNRLQSFDATFGLERTDAVTLHQEGKATTVDSRPGVPVFEDSAEDAYYDPANPENSVKLPGSGVRAEVLGTQGETMEVCFGAAENCESDAPSGQVERWSGKDRYATAAEVAKKFETAETVYLASGTGFADALTGSPAAANGKAPRSLPKQDGEDAPVLLTRDDRVPAETLEAIEELRASNVVILGGEGAVSEGVRAELEEQGLNVARVAGEDRYETSANVAKMFGNSADTLYVASGEDAAFADALSGSALAGSENAPVLLTKPDELLDSTREAIDHLNPQRVVVIGGSKAVSDAVYDEIGADERLAGADRYATSAEVAAKFDKDPNRALVANGVDFPDALTGGAYAGVHHNPLVLTRTDRLPEASRAALDSVSPQNVAIIGGTAAVAQSVEDQLNEMLPSWQ